VSTVLSDFTLGSILLGVALILLVVLFLARPFAAPKTRQAANSPAKPGELENLMARKEAILRQIRELDDDHDTAKIAPELYQRARPELVSQAALLVKQIDERGVVTAVLPGAIDEEIEAAVQQVRSRRNRQATGGTGTATNLCPQCLNPFTPTDRYCSQCGHILSAEPQAAGAGGN
jgi:hypothetical protein